MILLNLSFISILFKYLCHILLSRKGKNYKKEVILFNLKQEEYIRWLYEQLKNGTYKHGGYRIFYIQYPKRRKIEASRYMDRIVHRWIVDSFLNRYFVNQFINTSYACIKNRGMHKASMDVQNTMKHCKRIWQNYYILKMDIRKYFQNIDKDILMNILKRKVKEEKLVELLEKIVYSNSGKKGLPIGCTPVSPEQAKPGDLVFFVGTYDTPGVSHVGIYVGNSVMLHCGDPISYTNLNSSYWQQHFYCYGRLP